MEPSLSSPASAWTLEEFTLVACGSAEVVLPQREAFGTVTTVTA